MSVLALKAIGYGAEQIPDSFFEKIPGGFFTPKEKKDIKKKRKDRKDRKEREHRAESRRSRRDRSSSADDSASSGYEDTDTGDERGEQKNRERSRRAKSNRRRFSRSPSRGRHNQRSLDLDGEAPDHIDMAANIEQGQGPGPYFPPPPQSGNRPYSPQEYSQGPARDDYYHPSSTQPTYDYLPQPAAAQTYSGHIPAVPSPTVAYGAEAAHRYEEIQNANSMPRQQPRSSSTARYTPGPGYSPSPAAMPESSIPPPPIGSSPNYTPYNPADYAPGNTNYQASGNPYASPPPFYRQRSNSQPSLAPGYNQPYSFYTPPAPSQQMTQYNQPPSRRDSSTKRHSDRGRRARSADSHSQPRSSRRSHHYEDSRRSRHEEDSRMADLRGRFDSMDLRRKSLAATVGGALAGGFAGRAMGGRSRLTTIVGAAAGALGGRSLADKREDGRDGHRSRSNSRSRSRSRTRDRDHRKDSGLRARSRSVIERFRGKSRDGDERDRHYDSDEHRSRDDRNRRRERDGDRPRHRRKYPQEDEYDYFTESDAEGNGSPVHTRRMSSRRER